MSTTWIDAYHMEIINGTTKSVHSTMNENEIKLGKKSTNVHNYETYLNYYVLVFILCDYVLQWELYYHSFTI